METMEGKKLKRVGLITANFTLGTSMGKLEIKHICISYIYSDFTNELEYDLYSEELYETINLILQIFEI